MNAAELACAGGASALAIVLVGRVLLRMRLRPSILASARPTRDVVRWIADAHRELAEEAKVLRIMPLPNTTAAAPCTSVPNPGPVRQAPAAGQQATSQVERRHLVAPADRAQLENQLAAQIHGQDRALASIARHLDECRSLFTPRSQDPEVMIFVGSRSIGKKRTAIRLAAVLGGEFCVPNARSDLTGESLYAAVREYRIHGMPNVYFLEGLESSRKASDYLAEIILNGHPDKDDWSKSIVIIPLDLPGPLPEDRRAMVDALAQHFDRKLVQAATVIPFAPLSDAADLARIATQLIVDLAGSCHLTIQEPLPDAVLFAILEQMDHELNGAESIHFAVRKAIKRKFEEAAFHGWRRVALCMRDGGIHVIRAH
ncbi:MAG: hypothetical protein H0X38_04315 [Planctomycetes bacterium]|nr:hypothetical protein [Planctomycetota bacterium]